MPPTYQDQVDDVPIHVDIHELLRTTSHFIPHVHQHRNSTILPINSSPPTSTQSREITEEEVDLVLIFSTILLPLLIGLSAIAAIALLVRKMRRSESVEGVTATEMSERAFTSLPNPTTSSWREETLSTQYNHSVSTPHLLLLQNSKHSMSLPYLLAVETYYNYPTAASIMDETYQDVVDESKIQAEVENSSNPTPKRSRSLKRSLSLKSLRRLRSRIFHLLTFTKRRETVREVNTFDLYTLSGETRQQLKQIYVY